MDEWKSVDWQVRYGYIEGAREEEDEEGKTKRSGVE
jgi:hypothetical protein